jgi:nucleotide-binding universal stress UspA family protein
MGHIHKILVPIDGSPASIAGLAEAMLLSEDLGARVDVLYVDAPDSFDIGSGTNASKKAKEEAGREMVAAVAFARKRLGERLTTRTISGEPLRMILEVATNEKNDLIVIGTHGRIGRLRSLVGSVAEGVVRNAPCLVLTVRATDGEEESFSERVHRRDAIAEQMRPAR